jgi:hypothetical protein
MLDEARGLLPLKLIVSLAMLGALAFWTVPTVAQEPSVVQGFVADATTSQLIPEATIVLVETGDETVSGPDGSFSFSDAPEGPISVQVRAPGYQGVLWETEVVTGRALFLEVLLSKLEGDATLRLRVTHEESDAPIAGVDVDLPELGISAETDQDGEVEITGLPAGNWLVLVTGFGYNSAQSFIEFGDGAVTEGDVALTEGPIYLPGLTITAEMRSRSLDAAGFYDRERQGFGYHYDSLEIEEMFATVPSDLLRGVPGMWEPTRSAQRSRSLGAGGISGALAPPACPPGARTCIPGAEPQCPALYIEGIPWGGSLDDLNVGWIEAMEVFTRFASLPMQYGGTDRNCGVILIWLK